MAKVRKKVPSYWWDFEWIDNQMRSIVVQSDDDRFPIVGRFDIKDKSSEEHIIEAENLIRSLEEGRLNARKCYQHIKETQNGKI